MSDQQIVVAIGRLQRQQRIITNMIKSSSRIEYSTADFSRVSKGLIITAKKLMDATKDLSQEACVLADRLEKVQNDHPIVTQSRNIQSTMDELAESIKRLIGTVEESITNLQPLGHESRNLIEELKKFQ